MGLCMWVPNRESFKCDSIPIYHERFAWIPVLPVQSIELQIFVYEHAHESVTPNSIQEKFNLYPSQIDLR
ncbi:hypothetical protein CEXT_655761 [Caerostris extrusa]|uniref:Uncharacterized protein n=1 Tax=Caerostris extrusa TaxID=172846 RepID=A0AAV4MVI5_CAEEX|nr:hypothetical protein CEXT_655761 [Caerostris extrusa]